MSQLPPQPGPFPPQSLNYAPPPGPGIDLRAVATRQRMIMYCILAYLLLVVVQFLVPPEVAMFVALAALAVSTTAAVFVFMLALAVYNTATGIVLGIHPHPLRGPDRAADHQRQGDERPAQPRPEGRPARRRPESAPAAGQGLCRGREDRR